MGWDMARDRGTAEPKAAGQPLSSLRARGVFTSVRESPPWSVLGNAALFAFGLPPVPVDLPRAGPEPPHTGSRTGEDGTSGDDVLPNNGWIFGRPDMTLGGSGNSQLINCGATTVSLLAGPRLSGLASQARPRDRLATHLESDASFGGDHRVIASQVGRQAESQPGR